MAERKVFEVTLTGTTWTGEAIVKTIKVETFGDAAQAEYIVIKQGWPMEIRKADMETVRVA